MKRLLHDDDGHHLSPDIFFLVSVSFWFKFSLNWYIVQNFGCFFPRYSGITSVKMFLSMLILLILFMLIMLILFMYVLLNDIFLNCLKPYSYYFGVKKNVA